MIPESRLRNVRNLVEYRKGQRDQLQSAVSKLKTAIKQARRDAIRNSRALEIVRNVGLATQKQLDYYISEQVSYALQAVFDNPYQLQVTFHEKRGTTEADILFVRDGMVLHPLGSAGGGAIDVASIGLRIAYWTIRSDKQVRPIMLLDEPFAQLKGRESAERALLMLHELSTKLGLQLIIVSDERIPERHMYSYADKVFKIVQMNGVSEVRSDI